MTERTLQVNDGVGGAGFVQIPREQLGELTPQGFALHAALLSYGWRGSCWPGMEALGARTRMGEKALRVAKVELIEAGLLDETRRGQGKPNLYVVRTWDQRRAESRSSQTKVLDPPMRGDEVEEEEVEEDSLRSSSSEALEPSRPQSEAAKSNVKTPSAGSCTDNDVSRETGLVGMTREQAEHYYPGVVRLCDRLAELMKGNDPKAKVAPNSIRWMDAAEKLMRIDERHFEEAIEVLEFSQRDPFWQTNILSMPKFREKYPALRAKWLNTKVRASAAVQPQASVAELMAAYDRPRARTGV